MKNFKKGLTLIEMVVVIVIVTVLAAIILPSAHRAIEKAKIAQAIGDYRGYDKAIMALYADTGRWPGVDGVIPCPVVLQSGSTDLDTNLSGWRGWDGPYVESMKPWSPWGSTYYLCFPTNITIPNSLWLSMESGCYPPGSGADCPIPTRSGLRIDRLMDDGDAETGNFIYHEGDGCALVTREIE
jgi:general secretion pathway protein G